MDASVNAATEMADRLRARDPGAVDSFLREWGGAVHAYCLMVCEADLVAEAVEISFADFFEKVDTHPIGDSHLEPALMRSTRLTAAEAARIDWNRPGAPEGSESSDFDCALTPLYLAGSPSASASVEALAQMDAHVLACRRCRSGAKRFSAAEEAFPGRRNVHAPDRVLRRLLARFSPERAEERPEAEKRAEPGRHATTKERARVEPAGPPPELGGVAARRIGGFQLVEVGGEDADGVVVCRAVDELAKQVALRLAPTAGTREFRERFLRDARLLASLDHPSLPSVRAAGEAPEGAFVVTEELHAPRNLASVLEGALPTEQALRLMGEVANALDAAHAAGLVHRQLRPANIAVGAWMVIRPLVVSFAFGRSRDVVHRGEQTPYLAPEELRGEAVGPAADRYALACTLFELLTGRAPFGTERTLAADGGPSEPAPRASRARPELPPAVDAVFARALSEVPAERHTSGAELMSAVAEALSEAQVPAAPPKPARAQVPPREPSPEGRPGAAARMPPAKPSPAEPAAPKPIEPKSPLGEQDGRGGAGTRKRIIGAAAVMAVAAAITVWALVGGGSSDDDKNGSPGGDSAAPTRRAAPPPTPEGRAPVATAALAGTRAKDYDPNGGNGEEPERVGALVDGNERTTWQTELYPSGAFGSGVGAYISLPRPERPRAIEIRTTTPGWDVEIYGASEGPPAALPATGWVRLGSRAGMRGVQRIALPDNMRPIRFCLVWIRKLPAGGLVSIAEVRLLRR